MEVQNQVHGAQVVVDQLADEVVLTTSELKKKCTKPFVQTVELSVEYLLNQLVQSQ